MLTNLVDKVSPQSAAVLVMDIQNDFAADDGFFAHNGRNVKPLQEMVPTLERLIQQGRKAGVPIIFIRAIYDDHYLSEPIRLRHQRNNLPPQYCRSGTWGADFYRIKPLRNEPVIDKHRYNAYTGTHLDALLKKLGVETVICTGNATNVCVETTARDAYARDYHVVIVEDCCATPYGQEFHHMALENCRRTYGEVCKSEELIDLWMEDVSCEVSKEEKNYLKLSSKKSKC